MKRLVLVLSLAVALAPMVRAQEAAPKDEMSEGINLLEEGARLLFRGLMSEMEPHLNEMGRTLSEMEPVLRTLAEMIGDIQNYHPPEKQPNGDIIMRRKVPLDPLADPPLAPAEPEVGPEGEVEL